MKILQGSLLIWEFIIYISFWVVFDSLSFQSSEWLNTDMLHLSIEFTFSIIFFLLSSWKSYSNLAGQVSHSLAPNELVQFLVHLHVFC